MYFWQKKMINLIIIFLPKVTFDDVLEFGETLICTEQTK